MLFGSIKLKFLPMLENTIGVLVGEYKPANLQGEDFEALIAASPPPPSARAPRILLWNIFLEYLSGIFL